MIIILEENDILFDRKKNENLYIYDFNIEKEIIRRASYIVYKDIVYKERGNLSQEYINKLKMNELV